MALYSIYAAVVLLYTAAAAPVCCCCFHCWAEIAIGVSPCRLSTPYAPAAGLLPTATAAAVAVTWALLPSTSIGCCVRYSLLVCCCCATLLLLKSSYFFRHSSPWNHPPYTARFSDISSSFRQTPDCSDILTFLYRDICVGTLCCLKLNMAFFPHGSHQGPKTRDETKQGYLPRPVRDPEQRRAPAARGVRRGMRGMGQITLPATTARHSIKARMDAERDKRDVRFFLYLGGIRPSYSWMLTYLELEQMNKGQHFQIGIIPKLESNFFPGFAFFMAASKRFCPIVYSYYHCCCVSLPFGSVGIVLRNQRRMCSEYDSHRDRIWYSRARALEKL